MGRGPRTDEAVAGSSSSTVGTRSRVSRGSSATYQEAKALADAICQGDNWQEEIEKLNEAAMNSREGTTRTAAAGSRLIIAVNDIFRAETLAQSANPADQLLAETMLDSAMGRLGRIIAAADGDSPIVAGIQQAVAQHERSHGLAQIDDLERRGLIDHQKAEELRKDIDSLQREAYASDAKKPAWIAVPFMQRAAAAKEELEKARLLVDDKSDMAQVIDRQIKECDKVIKGSTKWLDDPETGGNLRLNADGQLLKAEAIVASQQDPHVRQLNHQIGDAISSSRDLVAEAAEPEEAPVVVLPDRRWLDLTMNYQMNITGITDNTIASADGKTIWLSAEIAEDAVVAESQGEYSPTLIHEVVHHSQPKEKAAALSDRGSSADGFTNRHRTVEGFLSEGATQALTNDLIESHQQGGSHRSAEASRDTYYPAYTAFVDTVATKTTSSPQERRQFYAELSSCPDHTRVDYILRRMGVTNPTDDDVRQFSDDILPVIAEVDHRNLSYQEASSFFGRLFSQAS